MAYPTVDAPYGLKPVSLLGGQPYAGSTRMYSIASGEGTAIYTGDVVIMTSAGTISKLSTTDTALIVGVFMGCSYTNATTGQKVHAQYAPATPPADTVAYVADDPDLVCKVAVCSSGTTMSGLTTTAIGQLTTFLANAGSATTGNSKFAVNATTGTATSAPVKIIGLVPETVNASGSATEVLVVFNPGAHFMRNSIGV